VSFIEDFTNEIYKYEHIILIDDIVTSGHTIQASLMALKPYLRPGCVVEIKALLSRGKI
jgi:pyrimidine operon attenuation protein/uracil phosphoribosyltransferase